MEHRSSAVWETENGRGAMRLALGSDCSLNPGYHPPQFIERGAFGRCQVACITSRFAEFENLMGNSRVTLHMGRNVWRPKELLDFFLIALAKLAGVKTLNVVRREEAAEQVRQLNPPNKSRAVVVVGAESGN